MFKVMCPECVDIALVSNPDGTDSLYCPECTGVFQPEDVINKGGV